MAKTNRKKSNKLRLYPSKYPSHISRDLSDSEWRKARTIELYDYLPQTTLEERGSYIDIRDELIHLNYSFFGYIASHTYLKSVHVSYEDKLQSAITAFCTNHMWAKYRFWKQFPKELAFSVFFKDRINECIRRDHVTVKYSTDRSLKMQAADQLGIHYSKLTYDDLSEVDLPAKKLESLKAIFYADATEDIYEVGTYIPNNKIDVDTNENLFLDDYDSLEDLLMHEMCEKERLLTIYDLYDLADLLGLDVSELQAVQQKAEKMLYKQLSDSVELQNTFRMY